jgi:negative regulator of replication initiation
MTKTVEIDDETYDLLRRQADFGENFSDVLRRLLSFLYQTANCPTCGKAIDVAKTYQIGDKTVYRLKCGHIFPEKTPEKLISENQLFNGTNGGFHAPVETNRAGTSALRHFVTDPAILCRNRTERYLAILGFAYKDKQEKFPKVLEVSGRSRKYFAASREEIASSGTSTHPHPIPGSRYWAMTNADTIQKREMLSKALQVLEYSPEEIDAAITAIADPTGTPA